VRAKQLVVVGGPNGAGKTTFAERYASVHESLYLAADKIAFELSPNDPTSARIEAAAQFVTQFRTALDESDSLVVESTLSGKTFRHWIRDAKDRGFSIALLFVFLESADVAVDRVSERRQKGGHDVPEPDIRRRFGRSLVNFWDIYRPLCDHWLLTDNSARVPVEVAIGTADTISIRASDHFRVFQELLGGFRNG
jgi:predicted ABC-type ATPase